MTEFLTVISFATIAKERDTLCKIIFRENRIQMIEEHVSFFQQYFKMRRVSFYHFLMTWSMSRIDEFSNLNVHSHQFHEEAGFHMHFSSSGNANGIVFMGYSAPCMADGHGIVQICSHGGNITILLGVHVSELRFKFKRALSR